MKKTKILAVISIMLCVMTAISACGTGGGGIAGGGAAASKADSGAAPAEKMDISVAIWDVEKTIRPYGEDAVYDTVSDKLGINIIPMNVTYDDYDQKIQVWAASSQLPDIFAIDAYGMPYYSAWVKDGVVRAFPDDLSAYPSLNAFMQGEEPQSFRSPVDGKVYGIPRPAYPNSKVQAVKKITFIRKDWMEACGYTDFPQSLDELIAMYQDIMKNNPDNTPNMVGVTCPGRDFLYNGIMLSYCPDHASGGNDWVKNNGQWDKAMMTPGSLEGVRALNKMFKAGVIDADAATITNEVGLEKFASGRAVALNYDADPGMIEKVAVMFERNFPDKKFTDCVALMPPFKNEQGERWYFEWLTCWSESYVPSTVSDEKFNKILELFDYLLSDEGLNLTRFGIEGVDYNIENGEIVPVPSDEVLSVKYPFLDHGINFLATWDEAFNFINPAIDPAIRQMSKNYMDWALENCPTMLETTDLRTYFLDYEGRDYEGVTGEWYSDCVGVIMSDDVDKAYADLLGRYRAGGYDEMAESFRAAAAAAGINP